MQSNNSPTEQQIEDRINKIHAERVKANSSDPLAHIIWIMDGVDLWHRTEGKRGHSIEDARRYAASQLARLELQSQLPKKESTE